MLPGLSAWVAAWSTPLFAAAFLAIAIIEAHRPSAAPDAAGRRWLVNLSLYAGIVLVALSLRPVRSLLARDEGLLTPLIHGADPGLLLPAGLLALDALSYALHRIGHLNPLWRFHAVHHADMHLDLTTGLRHHPGEFIINAVIGAAMLAALGLPPWIVAIYGPVAGIFDLWTHANIALPPSLERALSVVIVTPGMHRIHHSADPTHYGSNFGSILTLWDRLFGTYRQPATAPLVFGLPDVVRQGLTAALKAPFARRAKSHAQDA